MSSIFDLFESRFGGRELPKPAAPPKPAKVSFAASNPDVVAVGMARALDYASLVPTWTRLGVIESNGKPIAVLFRWTGEGDPQHPPK